MLLNTILLKNVVLSHNLSLLCKGFKSPPFYLQSASKQPDLILIKLKLMHSFSLNLCLLFSLMFLFLNKSASRCVHENKESRQEVDKSRDDRHHHPVLSLKKREKSSKDLIDDLGHPSVLYVKLITLSESSSLY